MTARITEPKDRLLDVFRNIAKLEHQIEQKKVELASQPRFNIYETFRFFDKEGRGVIHLSDLRRGLTALSLELSQSLSDPSLSALFKTFDKDGDGGLKFSEFSLAFDPI